MSRTFRTSAMVMLLACIVTPPLACLMPQDMLQRTMQEPGEAQMSHDCGGGSSMTHECCGPVVRSEVGLIGKAGGSVPQPQDAEILPAVDETVIAMQLSDFVAQATHHPPRADGLTSPILRI